MTNHRLLALLAAAALGAGAPGLASAQDRSGSDASRPAAAKRAVPDGQKGRKVLKLDDLEVEGHADRPVVRAMTPPKGIPAWRERPGSFLPKVVEAVEKEPF